jgi:hypothetical protein
VRTGFVVDLTVGLAKGLLAYSMVRHGGAHVP